jgi:hypothetical protein
LNTKDPDSSESVATTTRAMADTLRDRPGGGTSAEITTLSRPRQASGARRADPKKFPTTRESSPAGGDPKMETGQCPPFFAVQRVGMDAAYVITRSTALRVKTEER